MGYVRTEWEAVFDIGRWLIVVGQKRKEWQGRGETLLERICSISTYLDKGQSLEIRKRDTGRGAGMVWAPSAEHGALLYRCTNVLDVVVV